jgi:hypothetical protein
MQSKEFLKIDVESIKFVDTKGIIRNCKSKDRQYNGQCSLKILEIS